MKLKINIGECYSKVLLYSGSVTHINKVDEETEFDFTITQQTNDDQEDLVYITFDDLPEDINQQDLEMKIMEQFTF